MHTLCSAFVLHLAGFAMQALLGELYNLGVGGYEVAGRPQAAFPQVAVVDPPHRPVQQLAAHVSAQAAPTGGLALPGQPIISGAGSAIGNARLPIEVGLRFLSVLPPQHDSWLWHNAFSDEGQRPHIQTIASMCSGIGTSSDAVHFLREAMMEWPNTSCDMIPRLFATHETYAIEIGVNKAHHITHGRPAHLPRPEVVCADRQMCQ